MSVEFVIYCIKVGGVVSLTSVSDILDSLPLTMRTVLQIKLSGLWERALLAAVMDSILYSVSGPPELLVIPRLDRAGSFYS